MTVTTLLAPPSAMSESKADTESKLIRRLSTSEIKKTKKSNEDFIGDSGMFHEAGEHGNLALCSRYVQDPSNNESKKIMLSSDTEKRTALHKACFNGHVECVKVLLSHSDIIRANVDIRDRFGCTALYLACVKNTITLDNGSQANVQEVVDIKLEIVKTLFALESRADAALAFKKGRGTALHWCAIHGFDTVAMEILKHGGVPLLYRMDSNLDLPVDTIGNEVLRRRYRYEEQKIKVDVGDTMLMAGDDAAAVFVDDERRVLVPNATVRVEYAAVKKREASSALEGVLNRYEACAIALLTAVPVVKEKESYDLRWLQSMLLWCCYLGLASEVSDILIVGRRKDVRLNLTWAGISTQSGRTALHFAAWMGQDVIINMLKEFNEDPTQRGKFISQKDMQKRTWCCAKRTARNMGFVNYPDWFLNTPLHLCSQQSHFPNNFGSTLSTSKILLNMGADATLLNAEGRAAANYARGPQQRLVYEELTRKQPGFKGTCFDSPRVKNEQILSFDWIVRFTNHKNANGEPTVRSVDSEHHQHEMQAYLTGKRCLVRMLDDPRKEFTALLFTATEAVCRHHANELGIELPGKMACHCCLFYCSACTHLTDFVCVCMEWCPHNVMTTTSFFLPSVFLQFCIKERIVCTLPIWVSFLNL